MAPTKAAVLPLVKKDGLPEIAHQIIDDLKWDFNVVYDEKDAVGRGIEDKMPPVRHFVLPWIIKPWKTKRSLSGIEILWSNSEFR